MIKSLRTFFRPQEAIRRPSVPAGTRYYLIGDIHGRLDLFEQLKEAVEIDDADSTEAETVFVLLGDLIDRGEDSAGVVRLARKWHKKRNVRILAGNHEEMFLDSFDNVEMLRHFVKHGGRETLLSYGVDRKAYNNMSLKELHAQLPNIVPQKDRDFIAGFEDMIIVGDYAFVHAGIDPKRSIDDQKRSDMLWIRDRFLNHDGAHSHFIVHGHTITDEVDEQSNRMGIDTGAFRTGRLTALVLEGDTRRVIRAVERDGFIAIERD